MVARVAAFWRKDPFEVWSLPFTAYVALRDDYIDLVTPRDKDGQKIPDDISLDALDKHDAEGKGPLSIDYDAVLAQRRKQKVRRG